MKRLLLFLALCMTSVMYAGNFVMINVKDQQNLRELFEKEELKIHYYNDNFVLATVEELSDGMIVLDENSFDSNEMYFIVYCSSEDQSEYADREKNNGKIIYSNENIMIVKPLNSNLQPAKNDGMVAVYNKRAKLPQLKRDFPYVVEEESHVRSFIDEVSIDNLTATVEFLQALENRYYNSDSAAVASQYILSKFDEFGLETEMFEFDYYGNPSTPNIIGIQWGTTYPDEYVVCGSHYDSYSFSGICPGADDNATGVAAVIETARILSQHKFERSIIYCSFSAEELGLIGSEAYAEYCESMGMNIVGYFNNDMNGYLNPGDEIHIDLIYPNSVEAIGEYYMNVASVYFPDMQVRHVNFQYGDSDHTSFNQHGYMGIYPFEDYEYYSPYIHSGNDVIGPSVNSFEMSQRYTQMNVACVSTLAFINTESVEENNITSIEMYPNPAQNTLTLTSENKSVNNANIVNVSGQVVKEFSFEGTIELDIRDLKAGVYFVNILGENVITKKLLVRN